MERRQEVVLSAELAGTADALPSCCARHGRDAVRRKDFALQSRAKPEGSRFMSANALGMAGRLGEKARKTRFVRVRGWPLCSVCVRKRLSLFLLTQVVFWSGLILVLAAVVGRIASGEPSALLGGLLGLGVVLMLGSAFVFYLGSVPRLVQARASEDGQFVIISRPHPNFSNEVAAGVPESGIA